MSGVFHFPFFLSALLLLGILCLAGCATDSSQPQKIISLNLVASTDLNPDMNGRASPVAISIYQLANSSGFQKSDYISLAENGQASLGKDLLMINTITIRPGQTVQLEYPIANGEAAFGVVANYRVIDNSGWQLIYEYPRESSGFWTIFGGKKVSAHRVRVEKNRVQFDTPPQKH